MERGCKFRSRRKTYLQTPASMRKAVGNKGLDYGYLSRAGVLRSLLWSLYMPPKCCFETNRLPDISPAKMGLFGISRELQFSSSCRAREEHLYGGEKEVERATVNKESMAFIGQVLTRKEAESFFFLFQGLRTSPFWSPNSI